MHFKAYVKRFNKSKDGVYKKYIYKMVFTIPLELYCWLIILKSTSNISYQIQKHFQVG